MKATLLIIALCCACPALLQGAARPRVRIDTSYGPFVVELEPDLAPVTVANFLRYVHEGYYTDTIFHRVIAGFMVQGGGMLKDLTEKPAHEPIVNEAQAAFQGGSRNVRGAIAMARTDNPDSATSQFFLNLVDNAALDPNDNSAGYAVFGKITKGLDVIDKMAQVQTTTKGPFENVPVDNVTLVSAKVK